MQTLHASALNGVIPVQYPVIQSVARNQWIDVNNESAVTLSVSLGGRLYLIPPNTTARYAMDNTETFVMFTPQSAADPTKDTVSGTIYNEQDSIPVEIERGASASDILPITSAMIADGAVIAAKVATNAINTANIVAGAVGTTQLANGAVTNPILASLAVATGNIQSGAVTNPQLGALSVATGNVQSGAVGTTQLASGAVTNPILASLAVANANIQANAVAATQIATGAVTTTKIANLAVTTALIANAAVGTAQIANAAITTALIQTAAITDALIANVSAGKIAAGTITAAISIQAPTITGGTITGTTFKTAGSGARIEMTAGASGVASFYSGLAAETSPAVIQTQGSTTPNLVIFAPKVAAANQGNFQFLSGDGSIWSDTWGSGHRFRNNTQDVCEDVGNGSAVVRTVNYAASGYREHDASIHQNLSDIRFKNVREMCHPSGHHRDIVRQIGKPFKFNWKDGVGDNGKYLRWGLDARELPPEFTKQEKIGDTTAYLVDPQSMIAVLFGAVNDLIDEIELLKGSK